jgi:hypothetical protein
MSNIIDIFVGECTVYSTYIGLGNGLYKGGNYAYPVCANG